MHETAVICLCLLAGYLAWSDATVLFLAWYSGVDPPLTTKQVALHWLRIAVAIAAIIVATVTL